MTGVTLVASLITILEWLAPGPPAFLRPDMVIHRYVLWLISGAAGGVIVWLAAQQLAKFADWWFFAPRRRRIERFQDLADRFRQTRDQLAAAYMTDQHLQSEWTHRKAAIISECNARLLDLGVAFPWPSLPGEGYEEMLVLMERGGLRDARRRWPVRRRAVKPTI